MAKEYLISKNITGAFTDAKKFTISLWLKRNNIDAGINMVICHGYSGSGFDILSRMNDDYGGDAIRFQSQSPSLTSNIYPKNKLRSSTDWYHIVWAIDSTLSTDSDRVKLYTNGIRDTEFDATTFPSLNANIINTALNSTSGRWILNAHMGVIDGSSVAQHGSHQISEVYFIDGQAHGPTVFGQSRPMNNNNTINSWTPRSPGYVRSVVAFGNEGFYLPLNNSNNLQSVVGAHPYWRYVEGSAYIDHHPRLSQLYFVDSSGAKRTVNQFTANNQADGGVYQVGTQTWTASGNSTIVGVGGYVSYNGERGSKYAVQYSDNNSTWTTAWDGTFTADDYGFHTFYPQLGWDYQTSDRSVSNDFNNMGVTAEATSTDSATNNFCTINHDAYVGVGKSNIIDNGGRVAGDSTSAGGGAYSSLPIPPAGKWYFESWMPWDADVNASSNLFGVILKKNYEAGSTQGYRVRSGAQVYLQNAVGNSSASGATSWAAGDVIGCALDFDNRKIWISKNGSWYIGDPNTSSSAATFDSIDNNDDYLAVFQFDNVAGNKVAGANFGQGIIGLETNFTSDDGYGSFVYDPPTGFDSICEENIRKHRSITFNPKERFAAKTWTGTSSYGNTIDYGFKPDFVMIKSYAGSLAHHWRSYDSVRSETNCPPLYPNQAAVENSYNDDPSLSFNSTGFTMVAGQGQNGINVSGTSYIGYGWGTGSASNVSNTNGATASTVKADTASGFSVATFTHPGTATTVGHGLNKAPELMILKSRNTVNNWDVYHKINGPLSRIRLNGPNAPEVSIVWNNLDPTASVINLGGGWYSGASNIVAYCWHSVAGYSAFGQYRANDSVQGSYVYTGFKPAMVIVRPIGTGTNMGVNTDWTIFDTTRSPINPATRRLEINSSGFDNADGRNTNNAIDFLSDGFRIRAANWYETNATLVNPYLYMAWAETPSWLNKGH